MTTINYLPIGAVRLHFQDAFLTPGVGNHVLRLEFNGSADWLPDDAVPSAVSILVTGSVWTTAPLPFKPLGQPIATSMVLRRFDTTQSFVVALSDEELFALEQIVDIDDLSLQLKIEMTLLHDVSGVFPVMDAEIGVRVTHARWLQLLHNAGAGAAITLRVPGPLTDATEGDDSSLSQVTRRLRQARSHLMEGKPELCVASCRHVIDNLSELTTIPSQTSVLKTNLESRTKLQRWAAMYWAAKSLANGAHHDSAGIAYDRTDAEALLAMASALVLRFTHDPDSLVQ